MIVSSAIRKEIDIMAHTEKCRGCMYENKCDYITCRIEEANKREIEIRNNTIDECINLFADWFGYNYQNQGYYRLLNQLKEFNSNQEDFKERIERYNSGKLS